MHRRRHVVARASSCGPQQRLQLDAACMTHITSRWGHRRFTVRPTRQSPADRRFENSRNMPSVARTTIAFRQRTSFVIGPSSYREMASAFAVVVTATVLLVAPPRGEYSFTVNGIQSKCRLTCTCARTPRDSHEDQSY